MKLPLGNDAIIDPRKLTDYCLSPDHDDGQHKAQLFRVLLGLTREHAGMLLDVLREAAADGEAIPGHEDRYGQRYVIDFEFHGPRGRATIRSAWIIRPSETIPRLVTCYIL
jgi:hypothetical protein